MAKGYPSRSRARKAYWRGVKTAKTGRGINPYRNDVLKELFERGRQNPGGSGAVEPGPRVTRPDAPEPGNERRPSSSPRSSSPRTSSPADRRAPRPRRHF